MLNAFKLSLKRVCTINPTWNLGFMQYVSEILNGDSRAPFERNDRSYFLRFRVLTLFLLQIILITSVWLL